MLKDVVKLPCVQESVIQCLESGSTDTFGEVQGAISACFT